MSVLAEFLALLRLDVMRMSAAFRRPSAVQGVMGVVVIATGVVVVWFGRSVVGMSLTTPMDAAGVGMLLGAPLAFLSYGILFRHSDDSFLRRLGVGGHALFFERLGRFAIAAIIVLSACLLVVATTGGSFLTALRVASGSVFLAWGSAAATTSLAARAMAGRLPGQGWGCLAVGMWDRELARAAPLVYAPLVPLLLGGAAGSLAFAFGWPGVAFLALLAAGMVSKAARWWTAALPRFAPQAQEMAFAPESAAGMAQLTVGTGLARLLPQRAAAVCARDAAVASRRFAWATRPVWPVSILCFVLLARSGDRVGARGWVLLAVGGVLALQLLAVIGIGRYERGSRRWLDRVIGVSRLDRLIGRWAWAAGSSLWMTIPVALFWHWWAEAGPGWFLLAAGISTAGVAAFLSLLTAGER